MTRRAITITAIVAAMVVLIAGVLVAIGPSTPTYPVTAVFTSANGLFPGNAVDILGVPVGNVVKVANTGNTVTVTMQLDSNHPVPAAARAALVSPEILGEPSIELTPGYTGGPSLVAGDTIPVSQTSVPVSVDQLLKDLQHVLSQIDPKATGNLITYLSQDLSGQGVALNHLLGNAAGTIQLLAQQGNNLGQLTGALAQISGTLRSRTATITSLIRNYDTVSQIVSSHQQQLGSAITDLAGATNQLSQFLSPNLQPLESDVAGLTQVGRTVSRNLGSVDTALSSTVLLFASAARAYSPTHNWLNLNLTLAPSLTASMVAGLIRDRLAGICRRLLANHSAGLPSQIIQTLTTCGNPSSGFFDPLFSLIPTILNALTSGPGGGPSPAALAAMLAKGLSMIPGASSINLPAAAAAPSTTSHSTSSPTATTSSGSSPSLSAPGSSQLSPMPTVPSNSQANNGLGGFLGGLLGGF